MKFLTLIFGTMGCGKTAELLKIINKIQERNSRCAPKDREEFAVFKPTLETRTAQNVIVSRTGHSFADTIAVTDVAEMLLEVNRAKPHTIIIDECHFFETGPKAEYEAEFFVNAVINFLNQGKRVVVCGMIQNCYGGAFQILRELCPMADEIINPHTNCKCGKIATRNQRLQIGYPTPKSDPIIVVDDGNNQSLGFSYEPRCNDCWEVPDEPHPNLVVFRQLIADNDRLRNEKKS